MEQTLWFNTFCEIQWSFLLLFFFLFCGRRNWKITVSWKKRDFRVCARHSHTTKGSYPLIKLRGCHIKSLAFYLKEDSAKTIIYGLTVCISMMDLKAHCCHVNETFATICLRWQLEPQTAVHQLIAGVSPWKIKTACSDLKVRENRFSTVMQSGSSEIRHWETSSLTAVFIYKYIL